MSFGNIKYNKDTQFCKFTIIFKLGNKISKKKT